MCDSHQNPLEGHHRATTSQDKQLSMEDETAFQNGSVAHMSGEEILGELKAHSANIRAVTFWGDHFEYPWQNKPHMGVLYDKFPLIKKTLLASTKILCDNLKPDNILRSMKSKGALSQDDVTEIKTKTTTTEQVDKLIEALMRKPVSAYNTFMDTLQEERPDLYSQVKTIEKKQSMKRKHDTGKETKGVEFFFGTYTLLDEDIEDIVNLLKPKELQRLYKELNITPADKEEAKENLDPKDEARLILYYWREINGRKATRQHIIDVLKACMLMHKREVLKAMWGSRYAARGAEDPASKVYVRDAVT